MARGTMDVYIRIERQEKKILQMKKDLEQAQEDYEKLVKEREAKEKELSYRALVLPSYLLPDFLFSRAVTSSP